MKANPLHNIHNVVRLPPRLDPSLGAYCDKDRGEEFAYVFKKVNGDYTWVCINMHEFDDKWSWALPSLLEPTIMGG